MANKKRKAVLAGCGGISKAWFEPLSQFEDVEVVGLVDINDDNIKEKIQKYNLSPAYIGPDLGDVIEKSGADTVFDCTTPESHKSMVTTALLRGCDVLGEKPMAETLEDAKEMVKTAKETGKIYAVMQNRRTIPRIKQFKELASKGVIGNVGTLNADFYLGPHFGGFREEMKHPLLVDMAIHSFDQARFISGKSAHSVYCHEWNPNGSWFSNGASAAAIFEMDDGLIFNYRGSWCARGLPTSWECQWRLIGDRGTLMWDGHSLLAGEYLPKTQTKRKFFDELEALEIPEQYENPYSNHGMMIREFLDALHSGRTPQTVCTDNIQSMAMVFAAVQSAESGKKIEIGAVNE